MRLLILEDNTITADTTAAAIRTHHPDVIIDTANTIDTAVKLLENHRYTFFILDIILSDDKNIHEGIQFARILRNSACYRKAPVLFTTSLPDQIDCCLNDLHCYSYLLKPYDSSRLIKAVDELLSSEDDSNDSISIRLKSFITVKIKFNDITHITSDGHTLTFTCSNNTNYTTSSYRLKDLLTLLPPQFLRCHKCTIINTDYVTSYSKGTYSVNIGKTFIPVGRTFLKDLVENLENKK